MWVRQRESEWMDDPTLDADLHRQALAGLRRVNQWSRSGAVIGRAITDLARQRSLKEVRVLDLATGGGDVAMQVAQFVTKHGIRATVTGCDISSVAVTVARQRANSLGIGNVEFRTLDVLQDELPSGFDVVMCSLFLHHLPEPDAVTVLTKMGQSAERFVLVDDLRRTRVGYGLAWLGCRLLSRSPVVHKDGPLSVAGAFTSAEAMQLAEQAGLCGATITQHWPQRFLLSWSRP